ncbi:hypothetical protein AR158_c417R [Paramecium bursaria Chlorella virus AR158]|uniref:hypothetical protein n=1 Tax=Paramecium bursaria Chlorella virus AR158 TaxID=380598 RepID=UPI00015AA6C9|nr:hypothetical protein AR158_c417R [Paramecium bursaria Chlorella virus AR158]ABU43962.1 hypothetical protein AR158_c417R [Paramecium bursaria Chlorella virus AR158]
MKIDRERTSFIVINSIEIFDKKIHKIVGGNKITIVWFGYFSFRSYSSRIHRIHRIEYFTHNRIQGDFPKPWMTLVFER